MAAREPVLRPDAPGNRPCWPRAPTRADLDEARVGNGIPTPRRCRPEWPCKETDDQLAERRERACATMERMHARQRHQIKAIYGLAPEDDFDARKARLAQEFMRPDYTAPFRVILYRDPGGHVTDTLWAPPRK